MEVVSDNEIFSGYSNLALMNRAGFPPTMEFSPTSPVTTLPAATIAPSPIVTPGKTTALAPIQAFLPITTGDILWAV